MMRRGSFLLERSFTGTLAGQPSK